jgi:hypothetical protein
MNPCKKISLLVLGQLYEVLDLVGEEAFFKIWYLDLTVRFPLKIDPKTLLLQFAQCFLVTENGNERIFSGELVLIRGLNTYSVDSQEIVFRLCSYMHRLEKRSGVAIFKETCFRDIVSEIIKKNKFFSHIDVFFVSDLGLQKRIYTKQYAEESELDFINRYCHEEAWFWFLRVSNSGKETLCFFRKSMNFFPGRIVHQGTLNNAISLRNALEDKKYNFFKSTESAEGNVITLKMNSLSPEIGLGDTCEPAQERVVISIKHHFEFFHTLSKPRQYRNVLTLGDFQTCVAPISFLNVSSSAFQYGFVRSEVPHATVDNMGAYAVEILSDGIFCSRKITHDILPLLGYGGGLSHFSGLATGMQGLWYNNSELLLAELGCTRNTLKICGTIANRNMLTPVKSRNKTMYQWRSPRKLALSFEDESQKQQISWTTGQIKNCLIMGNFGSDEKGIELSTSAGDFHVFGNQGISISSYKKIKEQANCSRYLVVDKDFNLKNLKNKIHYESLSQSVFDFKKSMYIQSDQTYWKVKNTFWWSSQVIELNGNDLLDIQVPSGECSMEMNSLHISGKGSGSVILKKSTLFSIISISDSGKITILGTEIFFHGKVNMKGRVSSYGIKPKALLSLDNTRLRELKEPGDLSKVSRVEETKARLYKELIDPFGHKIGSEGNESGWMNLEVSLNDDNRRLDGNFIEKILDDGDRVSEFFISNKE